MGENPASQIYVRSKIAACEQLGLSSWMETPPATVTTEEMLARVALLNARDDVDGILVQLPLPSQVDTKRVLEAVDPAKDVDGFHPVNLGKLVSGRAGLVACTPAGCMEILRRSGIPIEGANAVVVGRSDIVGKPMALLLMHANATVTICHSKTRDLPGVVRGADIVVAAIGRAAMVEADWVRPGATVIDVGINRITDAVEARRIFANFPTKLAQFAEKGSVLVGDVHPGRRGSGRSDDSGAGRSGTADDRDADEQHGEGRQATARVCGSGEVLMLRVGLTGGIATGKSTVVAMLRELGCHVLEADKIAHRMIEPGAAAYDEVVREFGRGILQPDGRVDRPKLGAIVFADPEKTCAIERHRAPAHARRAGPGTCRDRTGRAARHCRGRSGAAGGSGLR